VNAVHYDVSYTPGIPEGEAIQMLGQEYHITSVESSGLVEVGSELEHTDLQPGDTVE